MKRKKSNPQPTISDVVEESWNKIGVVYHQNRDIRKMDRELYKFKSLLPENGKVLDVGCGAGIPVAKFLNENGFEVTGIDISDTMLNLAQENVPGGTFLKMNMQDLQFPPNLFDGVICVYSLFHNPRSQHKNIFKGFYETLKPSGILLINTSVNDSDGFSSFYGEPMYWSSYNPERTLKLIRSIGFEIISETVLKRGGEIQYWIFGKKQ